MSLIFCRILGPLVFGWAPNHFVLGAQLSPGEKMLVCIPAEGVQHFPGGVQLFPGGGGGGGGGPIAYSL